MEGSLLDTLQCPVFMRSQVLDSNRVSSIENARSKREPLACRGRRIDHRIMAQLRREPRHCGRICDGKAGRLRQLDRNLRPQDKIDELQRGSHVMRVGWNGERVDVHRDPLARLAILEMHTGMQLVRQTLRGHRVGRISDRQAELTTGELVVVAWSVDSADEGPDAREGIGDAGEELGIRIKLPVDPSRAKSSVECRPTNRGR